MQAVTALAHLRAAVLYFLDVSEQCGHSLEEQVSLYNSIKPLFSNKVLDLHFIQLSFRNHQRVIAFYLEKYSSCPLNLFNRDHTVKIVLTFFLVSNFCFQPLLVVCNKTDIVKFNELPAEKQELFKVFDESKVPVLSMSTLTEEGVAEVKEQVSKFYVFVQINF